MFKSKEEYKKDKDKKNAASGLKFLRKLGRKLRKSQHLRFAQNSGTGSGMNILQFNVFDSSPSKKLDN